MKPALILALLGAAAASLLLAHKLPTPAPRPKPATFRHGRWDVVLVKRIGEAKFLDVFTLSGERVLRYRQEGDDVSTRTYLGSPSETSPSLIAAAKKDFGIS